MGKTFSTVQVADKLGVHVITLYHWLKAGLIKPALSYSIDGKRRHYLWTHEEIDSARKLKAGHKPGPKPKKRG